MTRVSEVTSRARLREAQDTTAVCAELTAIAQELGFARGLVLLDARERGFFKVEAPRGYEDEEEVENLDFLGTEEGMAHLVESTRSATAVTLEATSMSFLAKFGLARAVGFGLKDNAGTIGVLLVGHAEGQEAWPDASPQALQQLLPDAVAALRHRILARVVVDDRSTLLAQKAEIEMLARELQRRNDEMLDDLEQAREFQAQMLLKPLRVPGLSIQFAYRPHDAVSGDLIDVAYEGTRLRILVADTTGHGLRAGLATMLVKAEYESVKRATSPAAVLRELNTRIVETYRVGSLTMTALCFDLDLETGNVVYASAAHPSAVVVRKDLAQEMVTGGTLIGLVPELALAEGHTTVGAGEGIYAYTDGISEAASPTNELFGEQRLIAALMEGHANRTAVRGLEKAAVTFTRAGGFSDDATIVGVARD